jgi:hypothetical protein
MLEPAMLELVAPLLVAALGGLTFLAYRHPKKYRPIGITLAAVLMISGFALISWVSGSERTLYTIIRFIPLESRQDAYAAQETLVSTPDKISFVCMCLGGYLLFLTELRRITNFLVHRRLGTLR